MALYPNFAIHNLQNQHGRRWAEIVERLGRLSISDPRVMAFSYTLRKLGMQVCQDALCAVCASDVLVSCGRSEDELLSLYEDSLYAIRLRIANRAQRPLRRLSWREAIA